MQRSISELEITDNEKIKDYTKQHYIIILHLLRPLKITFMNNDWYDVFKEFSNDENARFISDPPYLVSYDQFYKKNPY